jgi:hypothetical protein
LIYLPKLIQTSTIKYKAVCGLINRHIAQFEQTVSKFEVIIILHVIRQLFKSKFSRLTGKDSNCFFVSVLSTERQQKVLQSITWTQKNYYN